MLHRIELMVFALSKKESKPFRKKSRSYEHSNEIHSYIKSSIHPSKGTGSS